MFAGAFGVVAVMAAAGGVFAAGSIAAPIGATGTGETDIGMIAGRGVVTGGAGEWLCQAHDGNCVASYPRQWPGKGIVKAA